MTSPQSHTAESIPDSLHGFENIKRYWDKNHDCCMAKILPGEYYVTISDESVTTVLGSCVSACIRDRVFGVGGMNHFMLPLNKSDVNNKNQASDAARYGNHAMEMLINDVLKAGGRRENLEIKLFGGGKVLSSMSSMDVGMQNILFVKEYVETETLKVVGSDLGDVFPRKVIYFPRTGKVLMKKLRKMYSDTVAKREQAYQSEIIEQPISGDIELF